MNKITIYTDGGAKPNPGAGGYGIVFTNSGKAFKVYSEAFKGPVTNNQMELMAIINGIILSLPYDPKKIILYSDSKYCIQGCNEWVYLWEKKNWMTSFKKEVLNKDLWIILNNLIKSCSADIKFQWIPGHSNNRFNEQADHLATNAINRL